MSELARLSPEEAVQLQHEMAGKIIERDVMDQRRIRNVCGVDVSYRGKHAFACAVVLERKTMLEVKSVSIHTEARSPYIPGLFFLREAPAVLEVLKHVPDYDVLMVDAHGLLHPRRFGLACYIGVKMNKPTIGVGKNLLCGKVVRRGMSHVVTLNGKKTGVVLRTGTKPVYVSVGHMISLNTAAKIVSESMKYRIPEPLRLAHIRAKQMSRDQLEA